MGPRVATSAPPPRAPNQIATKPESRGRARARRRPLRAGTSSRAAAARRARRRSRCRPGRASCRPRRRRESRPRPRGRARPRPRLRTRAGLADGPAGAAAGFTGRQLQEDDGAGVVLAAERAAALAGLAGHRPRAVRRAGAAARRAGSAAAVADGTPGAARGLVEAELDDGNCAVPGGGPRPAPGTRPELEQPGEGLLRRRGACPGPVRPVAEVVVEQPAARAREDAVGLGQLAEAFLGVGLDETSGGNGGPARETPA